MLKEQLEQGWEGLTTEVAKICQLAGLPNICNDFIHRKEVIEAIEVHHMMEVKEEMETLSKMSVLKLREPYINQKSLANSRTPVANTHDQDQDEHEGEISQRQVPVPALPGGQAGSRLPGDF